MKIFLGSDHGGFELKEKLKNLLSEMGIEYEDKGCYSSESVDYPDYAKPVAEEVIKDENNKGILVCGSGIGMCMTANRFKGIRAALVSSASTARLSREHNNSNIICLGEREIKEEDALAWVKLWIETPFSNEDRHIRRLSKLDH